MFFPPRVYELAISHKLAEYLQDMFYKHNVDVEYDKYGYGARKELDSFHNFCDVNSTDKIRPDIIVHYRGIRFGNILVMEIKDCKASKTSRDCVDEKLKRLTDRNGQFGYLLAHCGYLAILMRKNYFFISMVINMIVSYTKI